MIRYLKKNKTNLLFIPTKSTECWVTLVANVGSNQDQDFNGLAHFVEHMLIHSIRNKGTFDAPILGTTYFDKTTYRIKCHDRASTENAIKLLDYILYGSFLSKSDMESVRHEVLTEWEHIMPNEESLNYMLGKTGLNKYIPIGNADCIHKFNYEDVKKFHKHNYFLSKSALIIVGSYDKLVPMKLLERYKWLRAINLLSSNALPTSDWPIYIFKGIDRTIRIYYHNIYNTYIANDISFAIYEDFIDDYFQKYYNIISNTTVSTILFDKNNMFMRVDFSYEFTAVAQSTIVEVFSSDTLLNYICKELTANRYESFISKFIENIENSSEITNESATLDAVCSFIYNAPLFPYDDYITQICKIERQSAMDNLRFWIYRKSWQVIFV